MLGTTSSFTPGYRYDSRNDPFDPNAGHRFYMTTQVAGTYLGGNTDFIKPLIGGSIYIPVRFPRHSYLAINGEAGYVHPYGEPGRPDLTSASSSAASRASAGSGPESVIPLDKDQRVFTDADGRILGGNKYFVAERASTSSRHVGPAKLLAFGDVGNSYHESQNISFHGPAELRRDRAADLPADLPGAAAVHLLVQPEPEDARSTSSGSRSTAYKDKKRGFDFSIGRTF